VKIRKYQKSDWHQLWPILAKVFGEGESYTYSPDITESEAHRVWIELPVETYVAVDEKETLLGTYYIKPNQPALGSHVCNCGYIVSEKARGNGIAARMCEKSQLNAIELGFTAMQYNFVVESNQVAIGLWVKLGFKIVGKLPGAFKSKKLGYIDAFVMYKTLIK